MTTCPHSQYGVCPVCAEHLSLKAADRDEWQQVALHIAKQRDALQAELKNAEDALHALGYEKHGFGWAIPIAEQCK